MGYEKWISYLNTGDIDPVRLVQEFVDGGASFVWHPLGFVVCKFFEGGGRKLRMHLWSNAKHKTQQPAWMIHDHLFDLKSWVLSGQIENVEYEAVNTASKFRIYGASYENGKSVLDRTESSVDVIEKKREIIVAGNTYLVPAGVLHESRSLKNGTSVTVCETIDKLNRNPAVIGNLEGEPRYIYSRTAVSISDLEELIEGI